ncbi:uncharacterized protein [Palaemon carinicauda]|uniref:uncharacterized protein isoform X2 n=1 Tax=Palaemon carinicauda TaxID=392227 RepID=UPI0035B5C201
MKKLMDKYGNSYKEKPRKSEISPPTDFTHISHAGLDSAFNISPDIEELPKNLDFGSRDISEPKPQQYVMDFIENVGGIDEVRKMNRKLSTNRGFSPGLYSPRKASRQAHGFPEIEDRSPTSSFTTPPPVSPAPSERSFLCNLKSEISPPTDFTHISHAGLDSAFNISPDIEELLKNIGFGSRDVSEPKTQQYVMNFIENVGGIDEVRKMNRKLSTNRGFSPGLHSLRKASRQAHGFPEIEDRSPTSSSTTPPPVSPAPSERSFLCNLKSEISPPTDFTHISHAGLDSAFNISPDIEELLKNIGFGSRDISEPKTQQYVMNFIENVGGIDEVRKMNRKLSTNRGFSPGLHSPRKASRQAHGFPEIEDRSPTSSSTTPPPVSPAPSERSFLCNLKSDISPPTDFTHISHAGLDSAFNISPDIEELLKNIGFGSRDISEPKTQQYVMNFIENVGGIDEVRKMNRKLSTNRGFSPGLHSPRKASRQAHGFPEIEERSPTSSSTTPPPVSPAPSERSFLCNLCEHNRTQPGI